MKPKPSSLASYQGRTGKWKIPIKGAGPKGFVVPIRVIGAKACFGRVDLNVEPEGGEGNAWIRQEHVTLNNP